MLTASNHDEVISRSSLERDADSNKGVWDEPSKKPAGLLAEVLVDILDCR